MNKLKKVYVYILAIGLFVLMYSCAYNKGQEPVPVNSNVSYAIDVKPILITHCFKCHSDTATNPDRPGYAFFNNFGGIQHEALKVSSANPGYTVLIARLRQIESPGMPFQEAPLPDSLIQVIQDWVLVGAPNN